VEKTRSGAVAQRFLRNQGVGKVIVEIGDKHVERGSKF
jgi:hypothetical protein